MANVFSIPAITRIGRPQAHSPAQTRNIPRVFPEYGTPVPSTVNKKIYQNPYKSIDTHQINGYAICMETLTTALNILSPSQHKFLIRFQACRFNIYAFSCAAHITPIEAATFLAEPDIQAELAVFDRIVAQNTERAATQARLLTLETIAAAIVASKDLVEARRLAQILLRITGARPKASTKDQISPPVQPQAEPPPPENHTTSPPPHAGLAPTAPQSPFTSTPVQLKALRILRDGPPSLAATVMAATGAAPPAITSPTAVLPLELPTPFKST